MLDIVTRMRKPSQPKFKDNSDGARSALKYMLDKSVWKRLSITEVMPDPMVHNVWKVEGVLNKQTITFIVYLNLPHGVDFEEVILI